MFEAIDIYCERTGPEFWSEPVNALTNAFFLVAAWFSWRRAKQINQATPGVAALVILISAIGIGSFLFHTFANVWSELADVIPIFLFQVTFLWMYLREVAKTHNRTTAMLMAVFLVSVYIGLQFGGILNGSLMYAPAALVMVFLSVYHWKTRRAEPYVLLAATGTLFASLTFRTVDMLICPCIPLGTHFLWHTCNAIVLYLAMRGLLANRAPITPST